MCVLIERGSVCVKLERERESVCVKLERERERERRSHTDLVDGE